MDTHSPHSLCFHFPLFPFSLFSYAHPLIPFVNMQREWPHRVLILWYKNPVPSHSKKEKTRDSFPLYQKSSAVTSVQFHRRQHIVPSPSIPIIHPTSQFATISAVPFTVSAVSAVLVVTTATTSTAASVSVYHYRRHPSHQSRSENSRDPRHYT
jgi:hypothetical protein